MPVVPRRIHHHRASRRRMLRQIANVGATLPFAAAFVSMMRRLNAGRPRREVRIVPDFRDGFAFSDGVIVHQAAIDRLVVYSATCTHLGCRISRVEDGQLVCPCHGSRFRADGSVASGPASRSLVELPFTVDAASGALVVDVT